MREAVIEIKGLKRRFGANDAVSGLNLRVSRGRCYGFFGRNGAGKTTTIKCLLNLLKPTEGSVCLFGSNASQDDVAVKSRVTYVPDTFAYYPWMTISSYFEYLAAFRTKWNSNMESDLLNQFGLDPTQKVGNLSKGQKMQIALIGALCPEPELLVLDEPTSGLDPLVRREFIRTVIGAYQDADPENRTVFVSTHMITEFEGLIDEFTIIEEGQDIVSMETEAARNEFKRIRARFSGTPPDRIEGLSEVIQWEASGRELEVIVKGDSGPLLNSLKKHQPESVETGSLTLEDIFLATLASKNGL